MHIFTFLEDNNEIWQTQNIRIKNQKGDYKN